MKIDMNLSWKYHVNDFSIKLNRVNDLLFKMRQYTNLKILRSVCLANFDSYLSLYCLVWDQNCTTIKWIVISQKRLLELLIFNQEIPNNVPLLKRSSILKFQDKTCLEKNLFVSKSLNNLSLSVFNIWFSFSSDQHKYETSSSTQKNLIRLNK